MTYPQTCVITEPGTAAVFDADFGQPTAEPAAVTVYSGPCRVAAGDLRIRRDLAGNADVASGEFRADQFVYLPRGLHANAGGTRVGPDQDIEVTDSDGVRSGRIVRGGVYTTRFYTRLMVLWKTV